MGVCKAFDANILSRLIALLQSPVEDIGVFISYLVLSKYYFDGKKKQKQNKTANILSSGLCTLQIVWNGLYALGRDYQYRTVHARWVRY